MSRADPAADPERWLDAHDAFDCATRGGAQALGCGTSLGVIEPGRRADLVQPREDSTFLRPGNDLLDALVFAETSAAVDTVLVDGRVVLQGGRVLGVDEHAIRERARERVERLTAVNRELLADARAWSPHIVSHCRALVSAVDEPAVPA